MLDVPIWQLDNLFLKRAAPITQAALSSNVSVVFLFSVIVLNQSQKSVIMTALLIVTGALQPQIAPQTKEYHACYTSLQSALRENWAGLTEKVTCMRWFKKLDLPFVGSADGKRFEERSFPNSVNKSMTYLLKFIVTSF